MQLLLERGPESDLEPFSSLREECEIDRNYMIEWILNLTFMLRHWVDSAIFSVLLPAYIMKEI
jgi:hypothetical protein